MTSDLRERIARFPRWHYAFDLDGHSTATPGITRVARHAKRLAYLFEPLADACGGSLAGKRVLDLGCNAGFWSLHAYRHDASYVLGVDARTMHVEQASLVFEVERAERSRFAFVQADLLKADWSAWGSFDVVLCLGLLYHVDRPFELAERIAQTGASLVLVDTALSRLPGAAFEVRRENVDDPRNAVGSGFVLWPTRDAVLALADTAGFGARTLEPAFDDWSECDDYRDGDRRGFLLTRR
jgi:SAM-dependent methyltransferase